MLAPEASAAGRWVPGLHQGLNVRVQAMLNRLLGYYLDEFTFRFNRRSSGHRGLLFYRLLEQAVSTTPWSYRKIVGPRRARAPKPDHNP